MIWKGTHEIEATDQIEDNVPEIRPPGSNKVQPQPSYDAPQKAGCFSSLKSVSFCCYALGSTEAKHHCPGRDLFRAGSDNWRCAMGESVELIGKRLTSGKIHEPNLNAKQLASLAIYPRVEPFDGDPHKFRLGIDALLTMPVQVNGKLEPSEVAHDAGDVGY